MREHLCVALVQFSPHPMSEKNFNVEFIISKIKELSKSKHELIIFPELAITNFFDNITDGKLNYWRHGALDAGDSLIGEIIDVTKRENVYVLVGFAERSPQVGEIFNSAMLIGPDGPIGVTRKIHLPGVEKLYFSPGKTIPVYDTPIGKIGVSICYDSWFPEYTRILAAKGAEIVIITASIWKGGSKGGIGNQQSKQNFWDHLPSIKAVENQVFVLACNGGGSHWMGETMGTWERMGLSKVVSPLGDVLVRSSGSEDEVLTAVLDRSDLEMARSVYTFLTDRIPNMYHELTEYFDH